MLVRRTRVIIAGIFLLDAVAGLLLSPYFIIDAILVTYLALFVGAMALTKGELPAWASRNKPPPRSKIAYYARWMKVSRLDANVVKTLSPFMKAVVSEQDRGDISDERLRALRERTSVDPGRTQGTRQPPEEEAVSHKTGG
jgi:hypothetical protein